MRFWLALVRKKLVFFLKEKLMTLWKALFLEKRILVFSEKPNACSTFIHSLLALYPCLSHFRYHSKGLNLKENHYNEYGLPLRFFHEQCPIIPYFTVHNVDLIASAHGFFGGTSNSFVKTMPQTNWDILIDIDKNSLQFKNDALKQALALTSQDKEFIQNMVKRVKSKNSAESLAWDKLQDSMLHDIDESSQSSEEWIRLKFYDYIKAFLTELEFFRYSSSGEKLDSAIEEYNKYVTKKVQTDEKFDLKDAHLSPANEAEEDWDEEENDDEDGGPKAQKGNSSGKKEERKSVEPEAESPGTKKAAASDPTKILKKELVALQESGRTLKKFGIDWVLKWTNTSSFVYWLDNHRRLIGERSINNQLAKNHFWFQEDGDIYLGDLVYSKRCGDGQFVDREGKLFYVGKWDDGKKSGNGKLVSMESGEVIYEGGFSKGKKHGMGRHNRGDGRVYAGEFKEGYKWGMGKLQIKDGDNYTGEFVKDKYHGRGQLIAKDGGFYSGDFLEGLRSGQGIYQAATGESYEGAFKNDRYEGYGKLTRTDGYSFEGVFKEGKLVDDKEGIINYPDGSKYKGFINDHKAHGYGTLTTKADGNEVVTKGLFENDKLVKEMQELPSEKPQVEPKKEDPRLTDFTAYF